MLVPADVSLICTSSASPVITAIPSPAGTAVLTGGCGPSSPPGRPAGAQLSVTSTSKRSAVSVSASRMGSAGQCSWCPSTAREHASPTASLTTSSRDSSTPLRLATAVATSRAVRTCAGSGVKLISTVAIGVASPGGGWLLLGLTRGDRFIHAVVDAEDLGQPGDPEDLENALLGADQVERPVMSADPLEPTDQHAKAGRVEELHLLHVHHELVMADVDQLDQQLTQSRGGVD